VLKQQELCYIILYMFPIRFYFHIGANEESLPPVDSSVYITLLLPRLIISVFYLGTRSYYL
jgi:hypothetical protein